MRKDESDAGGIGPGMWNVMHENVEEERYWRTRFDSVFGWESVVCPG